MSIILGIESSCDDTSIAVLNNNHLLSNVIASQNVHQQYGGVIPELASREHQKNCIPVLHKALKDANITLQDIDAIAVTAGPGLMGSLLVGINFAKGLAVGLDIPIITVNHLQGHILSHFISDNTNPYHPPQFPYLTLLVSGGHTQIVKVTDYSTFTILGETIDDAAGEAFDKCAKIMGLPYPGGPVIDKYARQGNPHKFSFAKPKIDQWNYSFSGFKTSFLYFLQAQMLQNPQFIEENLMDLCACVQHTIVTILLEKLKDCCHKTGITSVALGGGVSANSGLRNAVELMAKIEGWELHLPPFCYTTDNAAMIAMAGYIKYQNKEFADINFVPKTRM